MYTLDDSPVHLTSLSKFMPILPIKYMTLYNIRLAVKCMMCIYPSIVNQSSSLLRRKWDKTKEPSTPTKDTYL